MAELDSKIANTLAVHLASLTKSFSFVPPASVSAIIDCVLTSSVLSASYLFSSLLQSFPDFNEAHQSNYILCYTSALCHLMKNDRAPPDAMSQFISRVFIPLLEATDPSNSDLLNQTEELLYQVVFKTGSWEIMEKILVSFCLKSMGLSMNELPKDEMVMDKRPFEFSSELSGSLPKHTAYQVLTSMLEFALRSRREVTTSEQKTLHFSSSLVSFTMNLTWKLSDLALGLLKLSSEDRSYVIQLMLPVVLRSLNAFSLFKDLEHEHQCSHFRSLFLEKMWNCCFSLFQLGHIERRDAYNILSLYFSSFYDLFGDEKITVVNVDEEFDLICNGVFWEQIQRGLVDRDSSVRKMALYILKLLLNYCSSLFSGNDQCSSTCTKQTAISKKMNIISQDRDTLHASLTRREKWAEKEAKSMGVGEVSHLDGTCLDCRERWKIFVLLYEMLEEYGTHLVEAAWNHQILILFQSSDSSPLNKDRSSTSLDVYYAQMESLESIMSWIAVLWERGFCHENPQVRYLIMQSFLGIDWDRYENHAQKVPRSFILGPLLRGLNDPVQHKDFGLKGIYMSRTIEGASKYLSRLSYRLSVSERLTLAWSLASVARHEPFGRAGLMALAFCISSTTCHSNANDEREKQSPGAISRVVLVDSTPSNNIHSSAIELLDAFQIVIGRSKHHFNPNYRLQVSEQVLKAASLLINVYDVSLEVLLHFLSTVPRKFIDINGSLRLILQAWIAKIRNDGNIGLIDSRAYLLKNLFGFPSSFIYNRLMFDGSLLFDDEDIDAWLLEAQRWAWMLFLVIREDEDLVPLFEFFKSYRGNLCKEPSKECVCIKLLILILCFMEESKVVWKKLKCHGEAQDRTELINENLDFSVVSALIASEKFIGQFHVVMDEIVSFARLVLPVFWSISTVTDIQIPSSIKGKLGGPTPRRLATSTTSTVLLSIMAMRTISSMVSLCALIKEDIPDILIVFSWEFVWKVIQFQPYQSETGSELCLAAYEALAYVLKALSPNFDLSDISLMMSYNKLEFSNGDQKPLLDRLLLSFLNAVNDLLANGLLTQSRRAVLMDWKWNCLDSLLSIPYNILERGVQLEEEWPFFSGLALQSTLVDISESLETAGENSVLSILRSMRLVLGLYSNKVGSTVSSRQGVNSQLMFKLVKSSWILHLSCNKRRVAPIAALLSAVLHESVFGDLTMHEMDGDKGPLKWFIQNLLDEGTKSPRTMRLAALHLTGLWLLHPRTLKYYMKELILLSLYGSVAFDEDFVAELCGNNEAQVEVSLLAQSPDPELTEVFINTEMYARVAVAVLFNKLYNLSNGGGRLEKGDSVAALNCGKMFLLELLDSVVNERDLSKELYKKFSSVHRRKVRAWQVICILSQFVEADILENVTSNLHICLYRNNLPAVRQYLEAFAIQIYLKFPTLAEEQLIPIFYDYKMRPQALSSYVFIAANVILHSRELPVQMKHLDNLLPPVIPFLTSHHHSLRCFSQLLVYHVLCKLWPAFTACKSDLVPLEGRCFDNLKSYLAGNIDCVRIRASMEGFLENFDPIASATPGGVFNSQSEGSEFECVPVSLMELVIAFLNDVRDDLRSSFAKDETTIKNERLTANVTFDDIFNSKETSSRKILKDPSLDFQKKISSHIHEGQLAYDHLCLLASSNSSSILSELEMEDLLLSSVIQSRKEVVERIRNGQQQIILVASLLDRIPNLAGLARTCEIFRAACLAVADSSIVQDKQFQLISVTAEKWVPIIEVPVCSIKVFLENKRLEGFSILGLEQTANSTALDKFSFPNKTVLVLGQEKEGIPVDIIHVLDACIEIPQLGIIRSLNVHVSGAIALWEYTRQQRCRQQ